jgi:hypothetical protein
MKTVIRSYSRLKYLTFESPYASWINVKYSKLCYGHTRIFQNFSSNIENEDDTTEDSQSDEVKYSYSISGIMRPLLRIRNILETKPVVPLTLPESTTVDDAVNHLVEYNLSSALALNDNGEITGIILTSFLSISYQFFHKYNSFNLK